MVGLFSTLSAKDAVRIFNGLLGGCVFFKEEAGSGKWELDGFLLGSGI